MYATIVTSTSKLPKLNDFHTLGINALFQLRAEPNTIYAVVAFIPNDFPKDPTHAVVKKAFTRKDIKSSWTEYKQSNATTLYQFPMEEKIITYLILP